MISSYNGHVRSLPYDKALNTGCSELIKNIAVNCWTLKKCGLFQLTTSPGLKNSQTCKYILNNKEK